eukprot:g23311.t1
MSRKDVSKTSISSLNFAIGCQAGWVGHPVPLHPGRSFAAQSSRSRRTWQLLSTQARADKTLFEAAECQIAKVQPICINGCLGQLSEAATDIFSPGYLQRGSETVKSHGGSRFLSEFQCQAVSASKTVKGQLEEFLRDAQERGNVYIVLLDQRFFCEQTDAVRPLQWRSKTVLLRIEMQMQTRMAVQLDLSMPTLLDNLEVRGINLAGEEIARVCLNKQDSRTCKQKRSVATSVTGA